MAKNKATLIAPYLYVGGMEDAVHFDGITICVHEDPVIAYNSDLHLPILVDGVADPIRLDPIARVVDLFQRSHVNVLIHCGQGTERAPLCAAWSLHCNDPEKYPTPQAALDHVRRLHPNARTRLHYENPIQTRRHS